MIWVFASMSPLLIRIIWMKRKHRICWIEEIKWEAIQHQMESPQVPKLINNKLALSRVISTTTWWSTFEAITKQPILPPTPTAVSLITINFKAELVSLLLLSCSRLQSSFGNEMQFGCSLILPGPWKSILCGCNMIK